MSGKSTELAAATQPRTPVTDSIGAGGLTARSIVIRQLRPFLVALLAPLAFPAGAVAASSDAAILQAYVGSYSGTGTMTGQNAGTVRCRLLFRPASATSVNYTGRCSSGGADISMNGVITAANGRVRAAMSGSDGLSSTVTGVRRDGGIVFASRQRVNIRGDDRTVTSTMTLANGAIRVDFSALDNKTGKQTTGSIPFTRLSR
jgi:hypothetical protein